MYKVFYSVLHYKWLLNLFLSELLDMKMIKCHVIKKKKNTSYSVTGGVMYDITKRFEKYNLYTYVYYILL